MWFDDVNVLISNPDLVMPADSSPGYQEFTSLIASNARLETKIDMILSRLDRQDGEITDIRGRVEDLERTRAHSKGVLATISALGGLIGAIVTAAIKNYFPH